MIKIIENEAADNSGLHLDKNKELKKYFLIY